MQNLYAHPRDEIDPDLLDETISLKRGAKVRYGVDVLDHKDQPTGRRLRFMPRGSQVRWNYRAPDPLAGQSTELAQVRRTGTLVVPWDTDLELDRLRVWQEWQLLDGTWARFHLGVFEVLNPLARSDDGDHVTQVLELADKAHEWGSLLLDAPMDFAPGVNPVTWVQDDLRQRFGETRLAFTRSDRVLTEGRTFEAGISRAELWARLLQTVAFGPVVPNEDGVPGSQPLTATTGRAVERSFGPGLAKMQQAGGVAPILPSLPNVVIFSARQGPSLGNVDGNGLRVKRNLDTGPASILARQREKTVTVPVQADSQQVLDEIAEAEAPRYFAGGGLTWTGSIGLNPLAGDRDVLGLAHPQLELTGGAWECTSWTQELSDMQQPSDVVMAVSAERRVA